MSVMVTLTWSVHGEDPVVVSLVTPRYFLADRYRREHLLHSLADRMLAEPDFLASEIDASPPAGPEPAPSPHVHTRACDAFERG